MLFASPIGLLALTLLTTPQAAEPSREEEACERASPRIELMAEPTEVEPVVCISPALPLTFRFDSPLQTGSEKIQQRERFEDVAMGQKTLTLVPPRNLGVGERLHVEVCFADEESPTCATFLLLTHPGLGMQQVEVFRHSNPLAYFQQAAREARAENQRLSEEVRQLRAERGVPDGLRGVFASGLMEKGGIASKDLSRSVTMPEGNALRWESVWSYRAKGRVAVDLRITNPSEFPWTAASAVLRSARGEVLKPIPLWQPKPHLPSEPAAQREQWQSRVVVEVMVTEKEARGTYTLTLWDAEKKRTVILGNVTFP